MAQRILPLRDLLLAQAHAVFHCAVAARDGVTVAHMANLLDAVEEASDLTLMRNVVAWRREVRRHAIACETLGEA